MDPSSYGAPVPRSADDLDGLVKSLGALRAWAGNRSFAALAADVGELRERSRRPGGRPGKVTVYDCFRPGRSRIDGQLFRDLVEVLGVPQAQRELWWQAYASATGSNVPEAPETGAGRLPEPRRQLVGRDAALAEALASAAKGPVVVTGPPGAGKTEFGIHLARGLMEAAGAGDNQAPRPVGVAVNLRGFDAGHPPLSPAAVLGSLLRGLGVPGALADGLDEAGRVATLRRAVGPGPVVLLLDNAASLDQVEPLLPLPPTWRVVVTTRRDLKALPGAQTIALGPLDEAAGLQLLGSLVGVERVRQEPDAARRIVEHCAAMPLDLSVAAGTINEAEGWTLDDHAERLAAMSGDELSRPAIDLSYQRLPEALRRTFRMLALHPDASFTMAEAEALSGQSGQVLQEQLAGLVADNLLSVEGSGCAGVHSFHAVLRAFALRRGLDADPRSQQAAAMQRWADSLVKEVAAHTGTRDVDRAWFARRLPTLVAFSEVAHKWELGGCAAEVALAMFRYFDVTGELSLSEEFLRRAIAGGSSEQEVPLLRSLGRVLELRGGVEEARRIYEGLLERNLADSERDRQGYANVLRRSGHVTRSVRHYRLAAQQAARRGTGDVEGRALGNLGNALRLLGHCDIGLAVLDRAEQVARQAGDEVTIVLVQLHRVAMMVTRGDHEATVRAGRVAVAHSEERHLDVYAVESRLMIVRALIESGRLDEAAEDLEVARELADRSGMFEAALEGRIHQIRLRCIVGETEQAEEDLREVIEIGDAVGAMIVVEAHYGLGNLALERGDLDAAEREFTRSLELADRRGIWVEIELARTGLARVRQRRLEA